MERFRPGVARRYRFPITSHIVGQNEHDTMVRAAENDADSGTIDRRIKRLIVIESATVSEKSVQHRVEKKMESEGEGGGKGGASDTVHIKDRGEYADVPRSRIEAARLGLLSADAIRLAAGRYEMGALARWMDEGGAQKVDAMMDQRHGFVHSLSHEEPDAVGACRTANAVLRNTLDDRPIARATAMLVRGVHMTVAGRDADARASYETARRTAGRTGATTGRTGQRPLSARGMRSPAWGGRTRPRRPFGTRSGRTRTAILRTSSWGA